MDDETREAIAKVWSAMVTLNRNQVAIANTMNEMATAGSGLAGVVDDMNKRLRNLEFSLIEDENDFEERTIQ